ncbi:MAG: hypothetical protein ABSA86_01755 [Oryzomonas sp.]|jgi:hypothetical protein
MTRHIRHIVTAVILLLASTSFALGASLTVTSLGNGIFTVQGNNMDGVAGITITLSYDSSALGQPTISQGSLVSGSVFAANPNYSPNSIMIAAITYPKTFSGSGPVATVTFGTHTGTGTVSKTSSILNDGDSKAINDSATTSSATDYNTTITSPTAGSTTPAGPTTPTGTAAGTTTGTTTGSSGPTYLGTVTMPSDSQPQNEAKPAPAPETAAKPAEAPASAEAPTTGETPAPAKATAAPMKAGASGTASNAAVLERFRVYQGLKTPAIMIALFKQPISQSFRQEPFVALSDGTTIVTIVADLSAEAGGPPNFALKGAKLVSLKKDDASSTWFIEALPVKGALSASLMVLSEDRVTEYPLTIAPAIPNAASTETEFAAFLKDAAKTPAQHDVNGDGKYDGIDDYIYTANYLVRQQKAQPAAK